MTAEEFREWNRSRHARKKHTMAEEAGNMVKFRIEYRGEIVSLNDYKSLHWRKLRPKYEGVKHDITWEIIELSPPRLAWFELRVFHNTRLDMDNLVGQVKPFVDALRSRQVVPEDDKRYWDYLSIQHAPQLAKNSIVFEVTGEKLKP